MAKSPLYNQRLELLALWDKHNDYINMWLDDKATQADIDVVYRQCLSAKAAYSYCYAEYYEGRDLTDFTLEEIAKIKADNELGCPHNGVQFCDCGFYDEDDDEFPF